jgi:ABC-2 type transport system ATP-binding protein
MADVEALCPRVIVIHHGRILYDGRLKQLVELFTAHKKIIVTLADNHTDLSSYGEIVEQADSRVTLQVARTDTPRITAQLLAEVDVADLTVEDPPIESIIEEVFAQETVTQSPISSL